MISFFGFRQSPPDFGMNLPRIEGLILFYPQWALQWYCFIICTKWNRWPLVLFVYDQEMPFFCLFLVPAVSFCDNLCSVTITYLQLSIELLLLPWSVALLPNHFFLFLFRRGGGQVRNKLTSEAVSGTLAIKRLNCCNIMQ